MNLHPDKLAISTGRPPAVADGPLNTPIAPAAALQPGGTAGYSRDGHRPWTALEEAIGALEGGHAPQRGDLPRTPAVRERHRVGARARGGRPDQATATARVVLGSRSDANMRTGRDC